MAPDTFWLCSNCRKELNRRRMEPKEEYEMEVEIMEEDLHAESASQSYHSLSDFFDKDYAPTSSQKRELESIDLTLSVSPVKRQK